MGNNTKQNKVLQSCVGTPQELKNLIDYSDDSVVSKTILDKPVGTITLFAFDKGQGLSEHTSPYDAFVEVIDGSTKLVIAGREIIACAGQIVIMPANVPHSVFAEEKFKMLLVMIRK